MIYFDRPRVWSRKSTNLDGSNDMSLHQRSAPRRLMGVSAAAACIALVVAGCAGNSPGATGTAGSGTPSNGPTGSAGSGAPSNGPTGSAGSSTGTYGFPTVTQDPTAKITV